MELLAIFVIDPFLSEASVLILCCAAITLVSFVFHLTGPRVAGPRPGAVRWFRPSVACMRVALKPPRRACAAFLPCGCREGEMSAYLHGAEVGVVGSIR